MRKVSDYMTTKISWNLLHGKISEPKFREYIPFDIENQVVDMLVRASIFSTCT